MRQQDRERDGTRRQMVPPQYNPPPPPPPPLFTDKHIYLCSLISESPELMNSTVCELCQSVHQQSLPLVLSCGWDSGKKKITTFMNCLWLFSTVCCVVVIVNFFYYFSSDERLIKESRRFDSTVSFTFTLVVLLRAEQTQGWQGVTGERRPVRSHQPAATAVAVVMPGSATRVERWRGAVLFHSQQGGVRDRPCSNSSCKICRGEKERGRRVTSCWLWVKLIPTTPRWHISWYVCSTNVEMEGNNLTYVDLIVWNWHRRVVFSSNYSMRNNMPQIIVSYKTSCRTGNQENSRVHPAEWGGVTSRRQLRVKELEEKPWVHLVQSAEKNIHTLSEKAWAEYLWCNGCLDALATSCRFGRSEARVPKTTRTCSFLCENLIVSISEPRWQSFPFDFPLSVFLCSRIYQPLEALREGNSEAVG